MIIKLHKEAKLDEDNGVFTIYSWDRLIINPFIRKYISLPYKVENQNKFINFELNKNLALNGLQVLYNNLNEKSNQIEFLILNNNLDPSIFNGTQSPLSSIIGSTSKLDIKPNTEFGKIYL